MMGAVPDIEEIAGATGSTSGIALKLKFLAMQEVASSIINYLKTSLRDRIDLINILDSMNDGTPQIEDVTVNVQFDLPVNRLEEWKAIKELTGIVSLKTMLELLSNIDEPDREIKRLDDQALKEATFDLTIASMMEATKLDNDPEQQAARQEAVVQRAVEERQQDLNQVSEAVGFALVDDLSKAGGVFQTTLKQRQEELAASVAET